MLDFIKNISPTELIIIGLIITILFGSKVLVALGKTTGETLREVKGIKTSFTEAIEDEPQRSKKEVSS